MTALTVLQEAAREVGAGVVAGILAVALPVIVHAEFKHRAVMREMRRHRVSAAGRGSVTPPSAEPPAAGKPKGRAK